MNTIDATQRSNSVEHNLAQREGIRMESDNKTQRVKKALNSISEIRGNKQIIEEVMQVLDSQKLLHYSSGEEISLFSTAGRVLYSLMEDPTMTIRALAVYLDLSENMIEKTVKNLTDEGLITKTKVNRQNIYNFNYNLIKNHPDIRRLKPILNKVDDVGDEEPF